MDDIFRRLEEVETSISQLQGRENGKGELSVTDLANLWVGLALTIFC